jgi:CheY-like chemotaxis protein
MPVMGGVEATKIIRSRDSTYAEIPIVAFTAHAVEGVREECINSGMNEYLSKPIDYDELFSVIRDITN